MNLEKIRNIVNDKLLSDNQQRTALYAEIAKDESAIETVLYILAAERVEKRKLTEDINALLSKAHIGLEEPKLNKEGFIQKEIASFYDTGRIGHCFNYKK